MFHLDFSTSLIASHMPRHLQPPPGLVLTPPIPAPSDDTNATIASTSSLPQTPSEPHLSSHDLLSPNSAHSRSLRTVSSSSSLHSTSSFPAPPVTEAVSAEEGTAIDQALAQRHKKLNILRTHLNISDRSEEFDVEAIKRELHAEHEACQLAYRHIELVADGRTVHTEAELPVDKPKKARYVWEVMYENQRGLSLWGKTWYSSNSLLPSDPSPFTVPLAPVEGDVEKLTARQALSDETGREQVTTKPRFTRKSIMTGYDLETYQLPSPSWVWLTPWMVKMRRNTDEQGWRYNLWFHTKGWRSHAGRLNWWGWVRRREWVRLRGLLPYESDEAHGEDVTPTEEVPESFDQIFKSKRPVYHIVRYLATFALDREKQTTWDYCLQHSSPDTVEKLRKSLESPDNLDIISRAFVFGASRSSFFKSLEKHNLITKEQCRSCSTMSMSDLDN